MKAFLTGLATALVLAAAQDAAAQSPRSCAPRAKVVERLASQYGETRRAAGLSAGNALVEVFASEMSGTWTITATAPGGLTCLVASGQAFEALAELLPEPGADA